jgi:pimeloyl-ACP methyl ester carboxylesterase
MIVDGNETSRGSGVREGQRLVWQEFGHGEDVVLLLPTWSIVHSDFWRHQVPALAEGHRVIAYDGLGNGASDRPLDPARYDDHAFADDAVAVLDACGVDRAVVVGSSQGGAWALSMAGRHPERVRGAVFISPNVPLAPGHADRVRGAATFESRLDQHPGWARWNRHYWLERYPEFLRFFFGNCFTEPGSTAQIEHFFAMGMQTTPEVLLATGGSGTNSLTAESAEAYARDLAMPALVIHGDGDAITPLARGEELARLSDGELHVLAGSGHEPHVRNPEIVNPILLSFLSRLPRRST